MHGKPLHKSTCGMVLSHRASSLYDVIGQVRRILDALTALSVYCDQGVVANGLFAIIVRYGPFYIHNDFRAIQYLPAN